MRAIVIARPGGPEVLEPRDDVPDPVPAAGEVRVRVHASAVNRADLMQREGRYPAPSGVPADIPGLEYAGIVDRLGTGVSAFVEGDAVMGLVGGGGYAEYVVANAAEVMPAPAALPLAHAAAIPEVFLTAHDALVTQAGLRRGERVLVHAAGSGVGTAAVQLASAIGAHVFGTARSAWKLERCRAFGMAAGIDTTREDFAEVVLRETQGEGVDVVLDLVGGDALPGNLRALAQRGRLIVVGLVAGATATLDMRLLLRKRLHLRGTVMRSRSAAEKAQVASAFRTDALALFDSGRLSPVIHETLPMAEAARAHAILQDNANFGKVLLVW
jgi:putative PIG3 family NAD(P)H quinone oxidoreductase